MAEPIEGAQACARGQSRAETGPRETVKEALTEKARERHAYAWQTLTPGTEGGIVHEITRYWS